MMFTKRGERAADEASALCEARHPGVVELVDSVGDVLRTRMVDGQSLAAMGPLAPAEVAGVAAAVAATLADLHDLGVVHGGIDATHVLVAADGRPLLCSLGRGGDSADDVAALGRLVIDCLAKAGPDPLRRTVGRRNGRRHHIGPMLAPPVEPALVALASEAMAAEPGVRPTARAFADAVRQRIPDARLPGVKPLRPPARRASSGWRGFAGRKRRMAAPLAGEAADHRPSDSSSPFASPGRVQRSGKPQIARRRTPSPSVAPVAGRVAGVVAVAGVLTGITLAGAWALSRHGSRPDVSPAVGKTSDPRAPSGARHCAPACHSAAPSPSQTPHASVPPEPVPGTADPAGMTPTTAPMATRVWPVETLDLRDGVLTYRGSRYVLGDAGDSLVAGDWDCNGERSLALLRRSTGEIFAFHGWPDEQDTLTARPVGHVEGAAELRVVDFDGDGCHELEVQREGAAPVRLRVGS